MIMLLLVHNSRAYCRLPSFHSALERSCGPLNAAFDKANTQKKGQAATSGEGRTRSDTGGAKLHSSNWYSRLTQRHEDRSLENDRQYLKTGSLEDDIIYQRLLSDLRADLKADMKKQTAEIIKASSKSDSAPERSWWNFPGRQQKPKELDSGGVELLILQLVLRFLEFLSAVWLVFLYIFARLTWHP